MKKILFIINFFFRKEEKISKAQLLEGFNLLASANDGPHRLEELARKHNLLINKTA